MELLSHKSMDKGYAGHCPAQTFWASISGLSTEGTVLLLAGSRRDRLVPAQRSRDGN
jgi:hypothetical protein